MIGGIDYLSFVIYSLESIGLSFIVEFLNGVSLMRIDDMLILFEDYL